MAARNKSTIANARAGLTRALKDFEKTIMGMVSLPPPKKASNAQKAKRKKKARTH